jgi:hypothetical protein
VRTPALALACLLVLGWAGAVQADDQARAVKSIGIISAIGDTVTKQEVGLTVFDNSKSTEAIDDWQLDEFVIAEFAAQLGQRYEIKPVAYDKADFIARQKGIFADSDFDGEKSAAKLKPAQGAAPDAYIVVTKAFNDDFIMRTNQHLFGVGLYSRTGVREEAQAVYVSYEINVIDGHTLKYMTDRYPSGLLDFGITPDYDRAIYQTANLWGEGFSMTAEQRAAVRDEIKTMLRKVVSQTVKDFGF